FKTRGGVHDVANRRVLESIIAADATCGHFTRVKTSAHAHRREAVLFPLTTQLPPPPPPFPPATHGARRAGRLLLARGAGHRHAEQRQDAVARKLFEHSAVLLNLLRHRAEVSIQPDIKLGWFHLFGNRAEPFQVGEKYGDNEFLGQRSLTSKKRIPILPNGF